MEVLLVLILISIALAAGSVAACLAAIRSGQYDDLESPRWRMLFDDRRLRGDGDDRRLRGDGDDRRLRGDGNDRRTPGGGDGAGKAAPSPSPDGAGYENLLKRDVHTSAQAQRSNPL